MCYTHNIHKRAPPDPDPEYRLIDGLFEGGFVVKVFLLHNYDLTHVFVVSVSLKHARIQLQTRNSRKLIYIRLIGR